MSVITVGILLVYREEYASRNLPAFVHTAETMYHHVLITSSRPKNLDDVRLICFPPSEIHLPLLFPNISTLFFAPASPHQKFCSFKLNARTI